MRQPSANTDLRLRCRILLLMIYDYMTYRAVPGSHIFIGIACGKAIRDTSEIANRIESASGILPSCGLPRQSYLTLEVTNLL